MRHFIDITFLTITYLLLSGCATEKYEAKPIDTKQIEANLLAKDPYSDVFTRYLIQEGYQSQDLPFSTWGLDELTLCALFHHTKLDVAKAQLGLAQANITSAGIKQLPTINADIARSNQANGDLRPWSYGFNVDIPIETNNKRTLRIEQAEKLAAAARLDVADIAWQLRSQIALDLINYYENLVTISILNKKLATQQHIEGMLQKRLDNGLATKTEFDLTQLMRLTAETQSDIAASQSAKIIAKLASDVGLSHSQFKKITIKPYNIDEILLKQSVLLEAPLQSKILQNKALLNRIDVRRSIQKYLAAEAKIKLEVAKQTPDITLSPGVLYEFGDSIWSLGFTGLLSLLNKNQTLIDQAKQLREIEGAQFKSLQAQIIADLNQQYMSYQADKLALKQARFRSSTQIDILKSMQKQFDAGLVGNLTLQKTAFISLVTRQQVISAKFTLLKTMHNFEDMLQTPLYNSFTMPIK